MAVSSSPENSIPHSSVSSTPVTSNTSTTSATFVNFASRVIVSNFVKYRNDTKLVVEAAFCTTNDQGLGGWATGVNFNAADTEIAQGIAGTGNRAAFYEFTGVNAGTYTFELRRRRTNGVGNVRDGDNGFAINSLKVTETY